MTSFAVLLALLAPAQAGPIWLPPAQYDKPYRGKLTVLQFPWQHVRILCQGGEACATHAAGWCRVILPKRDDGHGYTPDVLARLRRHEMGHCNGWVGHDGAR